MSLLNLILIIYVRPFRESDNNKVAIINELFIYTCSVLLIGVSDMENNHDVKYNVGWTMAILTALAVLYNFKVASLYIMNVIKKILKRYWIQWKRKRARYNDTQKISTNTTPIMRGIF